MTKLFSLLIFLTILVGAFMSLKPAGQNAAKQVQGLPWQIEVLAEGRSRVFGITLGRDTLGQAREQLGPDMELAIIGTDGTDSNLEMYYDRYTAGVFSGKLILSAELPAERLTQMMEHSIKKDYLKTGARKIRLHPDDLPDAWQAPLTAITFIPTVNLDANNLLVPQHHDPNPLVNYLDTNTRKDLLHLIRFPF